MSTEKISLDYAVSLVKDNTLSTIYSKEDVLQLLDRIQMPVELEEHQFSEIMDDFETHAENIRNERNDVIVSGSFTFYIEEDRISVDDYDVDYDFIRTVLEAAIQKHIKIVG